MQEGEERLSTPKMKTRTQKNTSLPDPCELQSDVIPVYALMIYELVHIKPALLLVCSINPITGHVEEPMPNPIEEMTEEQKEYEAQKLVNMFDKLSR